MSCVGVCVGVDVLCKMGLGVEVHVPGKAGAEVDSLSRAPLPTPKGGMVKPEGKPTPRATAVDAGVPGTPVGGPLAPAPANKLLCGNGGTGGAGGTDPSFFFKS